MTTSRAIIFYLAVSFLLVSAILRLLESKPTKCYPTEIIIDDHTTVNLPEADAGKIYVLTGKGRDPEIYTCLAAMNWKRTEAGWPK